METGGRAFVTVDVHYLGSGGARAAAVVAADARFCEVVVMYLAPSDRAVAFGELARVVKPGGYLVTAFKAGDSQVRRGDAALALVSNSMSTGCRPTRWNTGRPALALRLSSGAGAPPKARRAPRRDSCSLADPEATRSRLAKTITSASSLAGHLCTRSGRSGRSRPTLAMHKHTTWQPECSAVVGIADGAGGLDNRSPSRRYERTRERPASAFQQAKATTLPACKS
jgi:hypothetical protein